MAKAPKRRLKVFQAQFGFHDTVVAAPSQAEALRVWGTRQNLFAEGLATLATNPEAIAAATAHPGVVLKRPAGSDRDFAVQSDEPKSPKTKPADRSALTAAEAALRKIDERRLRQEADRRRRQERLDAEIAGAQASYVTARKLAASAVAAARGAYRKAGGRA